ncbi:MAG: hypothetical protein AAF533_10695 [Acidobacteriota bacterium]
MCCLTRTLRAVIRPIVVLALVMAMGASSTVEAGKKKKRTPRRPAGVLGQDDIRRGLRFVENDVDQLLVIFGRHAPDHGLPSLQRTWAFLYRLEEMTDALRDDYLWLIDVDVERQRRVRELLDHDTTAAHNFATVFAGKVPGELQRAWDRFITDLKHVAGPRDVIPKGQKGWMPRLPPEDVDAGLTAIAEIEDLSDAMKLQLPKDPRSSRVDVKVSKRAGKKRHRVVGSRFERALLDFEVGADEIKLLYRKAHRARQDPPDVTRTLRKMLAAAQVIDHSIRDASFGEEAHREWREIQPWFQLLLDRHGLSHSRR